MKNKLKVMQGVIILAMFMTACGSGVSNTVLPPTEAVEATTAPQETLAPTVQPTATPTPEPTATPTPKVKDTYKQGTLTEDSFTSEWMNLRFTCQKGFELGTAEEIEMYAQCVDGARVEVYTELIPEEYMEMQEVDYLVVLVERLEDSGIKIVGESSVIQGRIGGNYFYGVEIATADEAGKTTFVNFAIRKKEARMIVILSTYPQSTSAYYSYMNLLNSFGGYLSEPVILPEEQLATGAFDAGVFTENGYENEWLNLRITTPEGATLKKEDYPVLDTTYGEIEWESEKLPYITYGIEFAKKRTADAYLTELTDFYKTDLSKEQYVEYVYTVDEQIKTELLGGQEYMVMTAVLSRPERADRYEEYYCRVQDNYIIYFHFLYEEELREQIEEAKSLITEY